jgi:calcineurin-like phosphoesterase family protein
MRRFGIAPRAAREQAQRDQVTGAAEPFQPLPAPTGPAPYRLALADVTGFANVSHTTRVLQTIGDTGGVKDPTPQLAVAKAMTADAAANGVEFAYHVGDISYFNGAEAEYGPQFYEAYADYNLPIFGIPGNHDGDPEEDGEPSLQAFMENFCSSAPELPAKWAEFNRTTMDQPNCYWTLEDELVTIIGLYTNVPSGGVIEQDQQEWLVGELKAAAPDRALIVALHHPPYSCDAHHGGSEAMGKALDAAFVAAQRWPHMVLSGHVHDYQRFTRRWEDSTGQIKPVSYVVCGAGGYHNLHAMAADAEPGLEAAPGVTLNEFDATQWGFLRLTVTTSEIAGEYVGVDREGNVTPNVDSFMVAVTS